MIQTLIIPKFWPARLNQYLGRHWAIGHKKKKEDRAMIYVEMRRQNVSRAEGKRRVSLILVMGPQNRRADPDACLKSLLDALVETGLLLSDDERHLEIGCYHSEKGPEMATVIILEDL